MFRDALRSLRDGLLSLAYPEHCRICGASVESWELGVVCRRCWEDPAITRLFSGENLCFKCGIPLRQSNFVDTRRKTEATGDGACGESLCGECEALPFICCRSCGAYGGALEASIVFLKSHPHIAPRLRSVLSAVVSEHRKVLNFDLIIPMPLHPLRSKERGFNQSHLIARILSKAAGSVVDSGSLIRTKHTERHRAGMDALDRAKSVSDAFDVTRPRVISDARVLLVDDLYTTGSTLNAATRVLLDAGASSVAVLTIARVCG